VTLRHPDVAGAIGVALVGVMVVAGALLTPDPGFGVVGPAALPLVFGGLIFVSAAWLLRDALTGRNRPETVPVDAVPLALSALALAGYFAIFIPVGFVLSSIAFLVVEARILGSRALVRDLIASGLFVLALYLVFTRFLTVGLPRGPLPL
jgi:putative tricarboxylic transport membrane protein